MSNSIIPMQIIENKIFIFRGKRVMIDRDLAALYEIETKKLNQAVKRNMQRFPEDFMFQLDDTEQLELVTNCDRFKKLRHSTSNAYVFTEQGVAMLSSVLNNEKAVTINIHIMRAFIELREIALVNKDLSSRLDTMERKFIEYARNMNINIEDIYNQLNYLTDITRPSKIGFIRNKEAQNTYSTSN